MTTETVNEYWDRCPCNSRHSPVDWRREPLAYSRAVTERKYWVEPHIHDFAGFGMWRECDVLELGCGIGTDAISFAKAGAHVTAVDLSRESLRIAMARATAEGVESIKFVHGDIERLDLSLVCNSYDLIYSFGVLHHTPLPEMVLLGANQRLRRGGILKIMLYHRVSTKVAGILLRHPFLRKPIDDIVAMESEAQQGSPLTRTYTQQMALDLVQSCGFIVTGVRIAHIFPYQVKAYREYRYVRRFPWNIIQGGAYNWLERHLGWHLLITARKP